MAALAAVPVLASRPSRAVGKRAPFRAGTPLQARPAAAAARRPARALAQAVLARASTKQAYICVDCGYIYDGSEGPFEKLPNSYRCPVCSAPKRRFKPYAGGTGRNDAKSMNARWEKLQGEGGSGGGSKVNGGAFAAAGVAAAAALAALYFYLSAQYN